MVSLDSSSDEMASSPTAPEYSSVSEIESTISSSESNGDPQQDDFATISPVEETTPVPMDEKQPESLPASSPKPVWNGFKIVGDNVDKNVRPTFQRSNHHTQSLHHFHSYAVKDRVNLSGSSEEGKSLSSVDPSSLIVTKEEWDCFKDDCSILIAR